MNRQEVNEYMQRFLDDDLNEEEAAKLDEYLRENPADAAMFERLKRLNSELEQLPKVTPPVSIVDSILPRLERDLRTAYGPDIREKQPQAKRRPRFVWAAAGAAAAASITLVVWIAGSSGTPLMTAEQASSGSSSSGRASISSANSAAPTAGGSSSASGAMESAEIGRIMIAEDAAASRPSPLSSSSGTGEVSASGFGIVSTPEADAKPEAEAPADGAERQMEFAAFADPGIFSSPDESRIAEILTEPGGGLRIRITDRLGQEIYLSERYEGSISGLVWSEDSSRLEFDAADAGGTETVRMVIDLKAGTELPKN